MAETKYVTISSEPQYSAYRDTLVKLFSLAENEINALVGEIAAYRFLDVRWSAEAALDRGVKVTICAYNPSPDLQNRVLSSGGTLYLAKKESDEKFVVVDKKHVFVRTGEDREGKLYMNSPKVALSYLNKFQKFLIEAKATPAAKVRWRKDPLLFLIKTT